MECYDDAEKKNLKVDLKPGLDMGDRKEQRAENKCDCLPSCTSIRYDTEISLADYDWKQVRKAQKINGSEMSG